jgi:hypothetical protein
MRKSTPVLFSLSILLLLTQACGVPNFPAPTEDLNFLGTAVMSTMISGATQTALVGITPTSLISPSPLATSTPEFPTATFTATLSPTPVFTPTPVFSATSTVPQISVSVATNCRVGPGRAYDRVGALVVGQVAEVVGRSPNSDYWYIRNPNNSNGFCWLWGEYATVTGNFAALPVFTPPPTPTPMPDFAMAFERLETCTGWWVDIDLFNTGGLTFESISLTVRDRDTGVVTSLLADSFTNLDGCSASNSRERLNPGAGRLVSSSPFAYDPRGHKLRATVTLCSRDGQNGTCITKAINITP